MNDNHDPYSFVGIYNDELRLPKSCDEWAEKINTGDSATRFGAALEAFLRLYKTLRTYRRAIPKQLVNDRDSAQPGVRNGREILGEFETEPIVYYRHLDMLDSILEANDELGILTLAQRLGRNDKIDYSKTHLYLDRAIYLENGMFVIDEMTLPRPQIFVHPVEIVQMYCFALVEIKSLLDEIHTVSDDIKALGEQFFERHLGTGDSLFNFASWYHTGKYYVRD